MANWWECEVCWAGILDEIEERPFLCTSCALRKAWCEYAGIEFWT